MSYALILMKDAKIRACSAVAVSANTIVTAAHCISPGMSMFIDEIPVSYAQPVSIGFDIVEIKITGMSFDLWAQWSEVQPKQGDRVRWWGNPEGNPNMYREGVIARTIPLIVDATVCPGDSGSGLFNSEGNLIGIVVQRTSASGCSFMVASEPN
jgi:V8-like Glu-specific endopeptidase